MNVIDFEEAKKRLDFQRRLKAGLREVRRLFFNLKRARGLVRINDVRIS